jgi:hypothetical protein
MNTISSNRQTLRPSFLASFTLKETLEQYIILAGNGLSNVFKNSGSNFGSSHQEQCSGPRITGILVRTLAAIKFGSVVMMVNVSMI